MYSLPAEKVILTVIDYLGDTHDYFTRIINNQTFIISNGKIVFKTVKRKSKFISKTTKDKILRNKFLTFDIETRKINGTHSPYCISFFDGKMAWSFFLSDFNSIDDMMNTALSSIMKTKYNTSALIIFLYYKENERKEYLCSSRFRI